MLAPFIDTVIICSLSGLVLVLTSVWNNEVLLASGHKGVGLSSEAFGTVSPLLPQILTLCVVLFAYSTIISWYYYGERACTYLSSQLGSGGEEIVIVFRLVFIAFVFFGAVNKLDDVLVFSDMAILSMGFPNIIGCVLLSSRVRDALDDYSRRYFPASQT